MEDQKIPTNKRAFNMVEPGTHYQLPIWKVEDGVGIVETGEVSDLKFVRGSKLGTEDVKKEEGILHETLLSVMIHDLKIKNGLVPSREGSLTITHLEEALHWQEERQKAREAAGVVGTYIPHKS